MITNDHLKYCKSSGANIARHNAVRDEIKRMCSAAVIQVSNHEPAPLPGSHKRTDMSAYLNGIDSRFDITIVSVTNPSKFGPHGPIWPTWSQHSPIEGCGRNQM